MKCILFTCVCGEEYLLKEAAWGRTAKCRKCGQLFRTPMPDAAGRISSLRCGLCANDVTIGDEATADIPCSCGATLKAPHVVIVDERQPLAEQSKEAHRQVAKLLAASRPVRDREATAVHVAGSKPQPASTPAANRPPQATPPHNVAAERPKPPSAAPRPTPAAVAVPPSAPAPAAPSAQPPATPRPAVSSMLPTLPASPPPVPQTSVPSVPSLPSQQPPPTPGAFTPPALPASTAGGKPPPVPGPAATPATPAAHNGMSPPPVPRMPLTPPTIPTSMPRRLTPRQRKWIGGAAAGLVAAFAVMLLLDLMQRRPSRQVRLAAQWETGSEKSGWSELETLQVRLTIENLSSKPIFIEGTPDELFEAEKKPESQQDSGTSGSAKSPFLERVFEQAAKDAMGDMEGFEGFEQFADPDAPSPRSTFRLQVAVGDQDKWNALSPHQIREDRGEASDQGPQMRFPTYGSSGWTIAPDGVLQLIVPVNSRPKGDPPQYGLGRRNAGPIPAAVRVRAVRATDKARLPELTVAVPADLSQAWTKES